MRRLLHRLCAPGVLGCGAATAAVTAVTVGAVPLHAAADGGLQTANEQLQGQQQQLPIDKLACHRNVPPPRTPTVLVSCGSFNPPTIMHMRMCDLATAALAKCGHDVWGCYLSPVGDAYGKKGLAPVQHRLAMARLAADSSPNVMVDGWEACQPGYTRTLQVLRHVLSSLQAYMQPTGQQQQQQQQPEAPTRGNATGAVIRAHGLAAAAAAAANLSAVADRPGGKPGSDGSSSGGGGGEGIATTTSSTSNITTSAGNMPKSSNSSSSGTTCTSDTNKSPSLPSPAAAAAAAAPQVMLLCGADLLATINTPGVWKDPDIILQEHGIVCVCRTGTDVQQLLDQPGTLLHQHRDRVIVVEEPIGNAISSTKVRQLLADGCPVRFLVPTGVLEYIQQHGLYASA